MVLKARLPVSTSFRSLTWLGYGSQDGRGGRGQSFSGWSEKALGQGELEQPQPYCMVGLRVGMILEITKDVATQVTSESPMGECASSSLRQMSS